jgi:hypothetical protein
MLSKLGVQTSFRDDGKGAKNVNRRIWRFSVKIVSRRRIGIHSDAWRACHGRHFGAYSTEVREGFSGGERRHPCGGLGGMGPKDPTSLQSDRSGLPPAGGSLELLLSRVGHARTDGRDARFGRLSDLWRGVFLGTRRTDDPVDRRSRADLGMERNLHPLSAGFFSRCGKRWDWTVAN